MKLKLTVSVLLIAVLITGCGGANTPQEQEPTPDVVLGVVLKESVGRVPAAPGTPAVGDAPAVGNAEVTNGSGVVVGGVVLVGAARAVCVSCAEICPIAVATAAVLIALTSTVGAGVAPTLQAVRVRLAVSRMSRVRRGKFRTSICLPP